MHMIGFLLRLLWFVRFYHNLHDYFTGTETIIPRFQCQRRNPKKYGLINHMNLINLMLWVWKLVNWTLQWRHNGCHCVSNHQPHDCLLRRLFRRTSKKIPKLRVTGLCAGNSPGPVNSQNKWPVTRIMFPFGDVIMEPLRNEKKNKTKKTRSQRAEQLYPYLRDMLYNAQLKVCHWYC